MPELALKLDVKDIGTQEGFVMENYQTMFNRIKEEHSNIRGNVKLVGDSINDQEALMALVGTKADWIPGRSDILSKKRERLQQTLATLSEGIHNHFILEAKNLPPLTGKLFMLAILFDHREIEKLLDEASLMVADIRPEDLSQEELLSAEKRIEQEVNKLGRTIEDHAYREEILMEMLEKGIQENSRI